MIDILLFVDVWLISYCLYTYDWYFIVFRRMIDILLFFDVWLIIYCFLSYDWFYCFYTYGWYFIVCRRMIDFLLFLDVWLIFYCFYTYDWYFIVFTRMIDILLFLDVWLIRHRAPVARSGVVIMFCLVSLSIASIPCPWGLSPQGSYREPPTPRGEISYGPHTPASLFFHVFSDLFLASFLEAFLATQSLPRPPKIHQKFNKKHTQN